MWRLFVEGLLIFHRMVYAFGLRAIPMFLELYVGRRGKLVRVSLPGGYAVWIRKYTSDATVFQQTFLDRESDFTRFPQSTAVNDKYNDILMRGLKPLIFDCGANTGLSSVFLAQLFPKATVVAVEPSDDNFEMLIRNVESYESIVPIRAGIWDEETCLKIINHTVKPWEYQTAECAKTDPESIAAVSITNLLGRFPGSEMLLIKIDIEGAEQALFRSNTNWVDRMPVLIVELHDWKFPRARTSAGFLSCVGKIQCDLLIRGENVFVFNWVALSKGGL